MTAWPPLHAHRVPTPVQAAGVHCTRRSADGEDYVEVRAASASQSPIQGGIAADPYEAVAAGPGWLRTPIHPGRANISAPRSGPASPDHSRRAASCATG